MDYETGKQLEIAFEYLVSLQRDVVEIKKKLGMPIKDDKEEQEEKESKVLRRL